jgi:predicted DsbA family dithiol-disulfide isomerase
VSIQWKPYFLSPNTPEEGEDLMEHLAAKYGRAAVEKFSAPGNPLDKAGEKVGITFTRTRRFVNTTNGHRLMEWCNINVPDKSNQLMEALFHAYFEEGKDVSKVPELISLASSVGLDAEAVRSMLSSDQFKQEVFQYDRQVKSQLRVSGVPYFIIESNTGDRPTAFSGAQPPEVIAEVLLEAQGDA